MGGIGVAALKTARSALLKALGRAFVRLDFGHNIPLYFCLSAQTQKIDHGI
jgi:hypothetical protein